MDQQPGFLILVVVAAVIGGGWLLIQMIGACISLLSVGLGCRFERLHEVRIDRRIVGLGCVGCLLGLTARRPPTDRRQ